MKIRSLLLATAVAAMGLGGGLPFFDAPMLMRHIDNNVRHRSAGDRAHKRMKRRRASGRA